MFGVIEVGRNYYINCIHYNGPQQPTNLKSLLFTIDYKFARSILQQTTNLWEGTLIQVYAPSHSPIIVISCKWQMYRFICQPTTTW